MQRMPGNRYGEPYCSYCPDCFHPTAGYYRDKGCPVHFQGRDDQFLTGGYGLESCWAQKSLNEETSHYCSVYWLDLQRYQRDCYPMESQEGQIGSNVLAC